MLDLVQKVAGLLTPAERRATLVLFALMLLGAGLEMLGVGAIPAFVALLANPASLATVPAAARLARQLGLDTTERLVVVAAAGLFALFLVKNAFLLGLAWVQARFVFGRQTHIAVRLVRGYLHNPYTFHLQRNTAELLRNSNQDAFDVIGTGLIPVLTLAMEGLTVAGILALLLLIDPLTSLAAFCVLGGTTGLLLRALRRRTLYFGQEMHDGRLRMLRAVNEGLGAIKVTKVLGREDAFLDSFARSAEAYATAGRVRQVLGEIPRLLLETAGIAGLLALAGLLVMRGRSVAALIPTLAFLAVALVRMIPSFNKITGALNGLRYGRPAVEAVHRDLSDAIVPAVGGSHDLLPFRDAIRLDNVTYRYPGAAEPSLCGVTLEIPRGTAVGFVGKTGAGKTTLVDVVLGLLAPTSGRVTIDGVDVRGRERSWQRQIGYVPQEVYLADDTIRRNVAFGLPDSDIDGVAVQRAVEAAQMSEFVERLPAGLETVVGERGVRLSGGQRQRIGIARALYHSPDVLVFDEATSALDHETEAAVMEAVEHLRGERTILMVAHRLSTVAACDAIVRLHEGEFVQNDGSVERALGERPLHRVLTDAR